MTIETIQRLIDLQLCDLHETVLEFTSDVEKETTGFDHKAALQNISDRIELLDLLRTKKAALEAVNS